MIDRLEVTPGEGTVIRFGLVTAWAAPTASPALLSFLAESARNLATSPVGGAQLADHLAGVLARRDPEPDVAFAVVGPSSEGWAALLHGPVQVWDGLRWVMSDPATGWRRCPLWPQPSVAVGAAGAEVAAPAPDSLHDLEAGIVPGGGFVLVPAVPVQPGAAAGPQLSAVIPVAPGPDSPASAGPAAPPAPADPAETVLMPTDAHGSAGLETGIGAAAAGVGAVAGSRADAPEPMRPGPGLADGPAEAPQPRPGTDTETGADTGVGTETGTGAGTRAGTGAGAAASPVAAAAPTAAAPPGSGTDPGGRDAGGRDAGGRLDLSAEGAGARLVPYPPLPPGGSPTQPVPGAPVVAGALCPRGHLNRPGMADCARCGRPITAGAPYNVTGTRPALGCLIIDDGRVVRLDTGYLAGSDPARDPTVRGRLARPLVLAGEDVSASHAEIRLQDWDVVVTDRASAGGTCVYEPDATAWERLRPYETRVLRPGTHIAFGQRVVTFVTPWVAGRDR